MNESGRDAAHRLLVLIWASLLGGMLSFAAVAWALATGLLPGNSWSSTLEPGLALPLLTLPVALAGAGIILRRSKNILQDQGDPLGGYRTRIIVVAAIQEGSGFLGIVLCLLAGLAGWIPVVAGLSAFAMVLSRPLRRELDDL